MERRRERNLGWPILGGNRNSQRQLAFGIMMEDLDRESGETLRAAMDKATAQLRSALEARSRQRRLPELARGIGLSILTASLLLLGLWLVTRTGRRVLAGMQANIERLEKTDALRLRGELRSADSICGQLPIPSIVVSPNWQYG
jgi:hypothetical protein